MADTPSALFQSHLTESKPDVAIPTPTTPEIIEYVVDTGQELYVENISHVEDAIRAHCEFQRTYTSRTEVISIWKGDLEAGDSYRESK